MNRYVRSVTLSFAFFASIALAQQPPAALPIPRITSVFPAGAQVGKTVDVSIAGTDLEEASGLMFSHPGLTGELIIEAEPKPDPKAKDKTPPKKKGPTPTTAKFKIAVKADVKPGLYDVRVVSKLGVSNPRLFTVGTYPELNETEPNNDVPEAQKISLGTTVNGVINSPTDVDFFQFSGAAGQRVLVHCAAGSIESRARPLLELFTSNGKRLAQNRNDNGTDALLDATLPTAGVYQIRLSEFAYQFGGPEHFYRLTLFAGPWIDAVFPPVVLPGKATKVALTGRNLNSESEQLTTTSRLGELTGRLKYDPVTGLMDGFDFRVPGSPIGLPIFFAREPVVLEANQPNDTAETAQNVTTPCEICGRIDVKNDVDWYRFSARKGEPIMIDLAAERIGSAMDCYLSIWDAKTKKEIVNENQLDDDLDSLHPIGFLSRSVDPAAFKFVPPNDGEYLIRVASRDGNVTFGSRAIYRLRIAPPRPDFRVFVMPRSREVPSAVICRPRSETAVDVYVHRIDSFNGPVTITAQNLPDNVVAKPALIGTNQKWSTLVLRTKPGKKQLVGFAGYMPVVREMTPDVTGTWSVSATAKIDGVEQNRAARPATITWGIPQNSNNPTATRLDQTLPIAIRSNYSMPTFELNANIEKATTKGKDGKEVAIKSPFVVKPGEKVTVPFTVQSSLKDRPPINLAVEPTHNDNQRSPLAGNNSNVTGVIPKEKSEANLTFEMRPNAVPGQYRFVVRGDMATNVLKLSDKKPANNIGISAFTMIDLQVLPLSLAKITVSPVTIKQGNSATVIVKLERQFDFAGEFSVEIKLPDGRGITSEKSIVTTAKDEAKLELIAGKDAKFGAVQNVLIVAKAKYENDYEVTHEAKVTMTVIK